MKRIILSVLMFAVGVAAYGQSDIFLTQQWFSRINMNPAATGNSNNVDVFLLNRQQWIGFENAPRTSILNAHSYFNAIQSGLGLSMMFDKIGASRQTLNAMASYAYHISLTDEILLSLGLSGGIYNSNWDPSRNRFNEEVDDGSLSDKSSRTAGDFNAGFEMNVYGVIFGASLTHLLNSSPDIGKPGREVYGYARYRWAVSRDIDIAPGVMFRNANYCNFFDVNITGFYLKKYWAGLSFRPNNSMAIMLGGEFGMFRVGYAYDRSIGNVLSLAANTHEFMLSVRIQKPQKGRKTTRFLD